MSTVVKATMARVILVVFSIAITLLLMELAIRLFSPQPLNHYNFTLIQLDGADEMVLGPKISAHRQKPKDFGPYIPNLSTNFAGVKVTINSRGWRDDEHSLEKPPGVTRIMVVGDSVVFGYGVQADEMFPKVLERGLNRQGPGRYQVVSLGGAGGNTYSQRRIIKDNVRLYDPDLVILAFNLNDILPKIFGRGNESSAGIGLSIFKTAVRLRMTLDRAFRARSHLYFLVRERMKVVLRKFGIASPTVVPLAAFDIKSDSGIAALWDTREALMDIAAQLRKDRVPFLLAILPADMQVSPKIADLYRREYGFVFDDSLVAGTPQKIIANFARQHGIDCIDLLPSFRTDPEEKKFFRIYGASIDWNHPNRLGHKIIAAELEKLLSSSAALPQADGRAGQGALVPRKQKRTPPSTVPVSLPHDPMSPNNELPKTPDHDL